jgi:hypothetical protein
VSITNIVSGGYGFSNVVPGNKTMTFTALGENFAVALDTLRARKGRSALTILGIVIGVTSVIAIAAIIDGLNGYVQGRISKLGARTFFITRITAAQVSGRKAISPPSQTQFMKPADAPMSAPPEMPSAKTCAMFIWRPTFLGVLLPRA